MTRPLARFAILLITITVVGTGGFMFVEGWGFIDSLYMTVITLSTVGFQEVRPLSEGGRLFTTFLIAGGVIAVTYLFSALSHHIVSGELTGTIWRRRMHKAIEGMRDHYIICGYGRVGRQVAVDLEQDGQTCIVVEIGDAGSAERDADRVVLQGDAADDEVLKAAGIERARGLVAVTGDDAVNLFITVTAHALNEDLPIVARANQPSTEPKLMRAGATHVISPYTLSGRRIATQLLYPSITDFLDVVMHSGSLELWLEECDVVAGSALDGTTVGDANLRDTTGANVLALRRHADGRILTSLPGEMEFTPGDTLIALGTRAQLSTLKALGAG